MATATFQQPFSVNAHLNDHSRLLLPKVELSTVNFPANAEFSRLNFYPSFPSTSSSKEYAGHVRSIPNVDGSTKEKVPTPMLDMIKNPMHLKNLTPKELKQLADDIRSELSFMMSQTQKSFKASLSVVELTVAIHHVFHAPVDKILWDIEDQTYPHKLLTGRRPLVSALSEGNGLGSSTRCCESDFDPFGAGHGCSSISSGLGMAVARDLKGKRDRIVAVISNETTMAGQPKLEQTPKTSVNALSSTLSKLQSSKIFRRFREIAKVLTKRIGGGMHEWAAKIDEYARGMMGPPGSTLFEELGLYYIGPVDGHKIEDLLCVLHEVASLDSMGPVLVHVITKEEPGVEYNTIKTSNENYTDSCTSELLPCNPRLRTYTDCFVEALITESEKDEDIVVVHAGMGMEAPFQFLKNKLQDKFFDVGMAEQHAVTFSAGLSCGGLKPFCIIPSAFLQRAYDQVVHDVDRQKIPVRFAITSAGLVGSDGPTHSGAFDITFMSCLPNMIVMAPSDETELARMVTTAACIDDRPVCFRYPRGAMAKLNPDPCIIEPIEIGKGKILIEGKDIALLGYGSMVQNCLRAHSLLSKLGVDVTVADARFCKPLDINLVRMLCKNHAFLITVEEGSIGGFGAHVAQFISLDGQLDAGIKWRPITLPDNYIEGAVPKDQLALAGLSGNHIAATALSLLGRTRDALLIMC
ncbi:probable 1-deoxy-D-xylulose-5-phosphate synthase, chloroplastic [Olea europaea subsp. europaea]|uniref:1-deoxy-D-xylulose-5-phosphate synthase n=1 Tax=Olea europaea subsp. europaea TaxID=158383 RepID=A0A8S0P6C2_OLEEU|nr:probable 1-deoxy-D-xylulose-5-phosphate synthase, chloroplastic [Olea europaea subsp. europaea]